jgi:predicted CXXCH cytochrome family protein
MRGATLLATGLFLFRTDVLDAQDAPHSTTEGLTCVSCHLDHEQFGNQIGSTVGNPNVCLSCHQVGGLASSHALAASQQSKLRPAAAGQPPATGNSHRWDSRLSGHVEALSAAPSGALVPNGTFTGRYAMSYTVTITAGGRSGSAQFAWTATGPGGGSQSGLPTGPDVPLDSGVRLSFLDRARGGEYATGDRWRIDIRPGLNSPADAGLLRTMGAGEVTCVTCHDPHFQDRAPFDPQASDYIPGQGDGRHFMRIDTDQDQLCTECHASHFATNALAGSHPVGLLIASNSWIHPPASLPQDKRAGKMGCSTCHQIHNAPDNNGNLLRMADEGTLCQQCHALAVTNAPGSHCNPATGAAWPGGQYGSLLPSDPDATPRGGCGNCHRAHGWPDSANTNSNYPNLLVEREENLCYTCHDGNPIAKDLRTNFAKTYRHPVTYSGRHSTSEEGNPAQYGTANRHAECTDCHNPHQLASDTTPPVAPAASSALRGVARVAVANLSATSVTYTFRSANDPTPVKEYEVCFVCHSGWSTRPAGQANYAAKFNTRTASFHPVEGPGKNTNINVNAFVNGWRATNLMTCTDCHTSDNTAIRGPHGSSQPFILKKLAIASPARRSTVMASTELCFDCHRFDTYANSSASSTIKNYSRFGSSNGHAYHVGSRRYPCYTCHESHGATTLPNLLVTGRSPGIQTYTRTTNGGSCVATCHGSESYSVAYPR